MKSATYKTAAESFVGHGLRKERLHSKVTRRQQKHDMLLTFMANQPAPKPRSLKRRPSFLRSILSIFL